MSYEVEVREVAPQPMVGIRRTCTMQKIQATLAEVLGGSFAFAKRSGLEPVGPPFTIYHCSAEGEIDLEGGCPVARAPEGEPDGDVRAGELPGGEVATTWHVGPYDGLAQAYGALQAWMSANGREPRGAPWEVYWSDPQQEPDPAKWKTEVIWPIR